MTRRLAQVRRALRMVGLYCNWPTAYRNRFGRRAGSGEVVYRLRGGARLSVDRGPVSVKMLNETWLDRVYEPTPSFRVQPGWIVVDAGSHKGTFALRAALAGARLVVSVEPAPFNLLHLRRNVALNGASNVRVIEAAIGTSRGQLKFHLDPAHSHTGSLVHEHDYSESVAVNAITLADVLEIAGERVDLLKMDIEGAEADVLRTTSTETLNRVDRLILEYHGAQGEAGGRKSDTARAVRSILENAGFRCTMLPHVSLLYAERGTV